MIALRTRASDPRALVVAALLAFWTMLALGPLVSVVPTVSWGRTVLLWTPPLLLLARVLGFGRGWPLANFALGWIWLTTAASLYSFLVAVAPLSAAVPAALAVAVVLATRRPVATVVLAFAISGAFGTITAFTPLRAGPVVDLAIAGLLGAGAWLYLVRGHRPAPAWVWPGVLAAGGFLTLTALEILAAPSPILGVHSYRASHWYMLSFLVVAYFAWRPGDLMRIAKAFVVVGALVGGYAALRWQIGPSGQEAAQAISSASVYNFVEGKLRLFGSFTSGHELAAWTAAVIPFMVAVGLTLRGRWGIVAALGAALCGIGLLGSEVRISLIAVSVGLAVVLVLYQLSRGFKGLHLGATAFFVAGAALVGVGAFAATVGSEPGRSDRFANILTPEKDAAYQARVVKWETAIAQLEDKPFGHGLGTAGRVQQRSGRFVTVASVNVDSGYLKIAWEQGFAVLAFFVIACLLLLGGLGRRALATPDRWRAGLAIGAAGTLAAYLVLLFAAVYNEGLTALAAWLVVGIGVGQFARLPQRRAAS